MNPQAQAQQKIEQRLAAAGWQIQNIRRANILAAKGVAIRQFPLLGEYGYADYMLYIDGKAAAVIEVKPVGIALTGVDIQAEKYTKGLPETLPAWRLPLAFSYEATGEETLFANHLDLEPQSQPVETFHRPQELAELLEELGDH